MTEAAKESAWACILPFLRPIEGLIHDPDISDIMVNGERGVFFEKDGRMEQLPGVLLQEQYLQVAARNIARSLGDEISEESPILDTRIPDGSRVSIVLSPVSVHGTTLTIRKFPTHRYDADELVRVGTWPQDLCQQIRQAIRDGRNILISGGTGTGKTTLLNAIAAFIPPAERLIVIEDTAEIQIQHTNAVRLQARQAQRDLPAISSRQLLKASLRMRPDRILIGEVRGEEAFDLLQALNTGHQGTLSTIHANSAAETLTRFATCVMMAGIELPHRTVRANIGDALPLIVHLKRPGGRRSVTEVLRVDGYDLPNDEYRLKVLYQK